jgi:hypothetical protein
MLYDSETRAHHSTVQANADNQLRLLSQITSMADILSTAQNIARAPQWNINRQDLNITRTVIEPRNNKDTFTLASDDGPLVVYEGRGIAIKQ